MARSMISVLLVVSISASMAQAAVGLTPHPAQPPPPPEPVRAAAFHAAIWRLAQASVVAVDSTVHYTREQGMVDGKTYALRTVGTGGRCGVGALLGVYTLGVAVPIAYFATGPASLSDSDRRYMAAKGDEYVRGFEAAFTDKSRSVRRNAVLAGGLSGLAFWVFNIALVYDYATSTDSGD